MRRESERLRKHAVYVEESLDGLAGWTAADDGAARATIDATVSM